MSPVCSVMRPTRSPFTVVPFVEARSCSIHTPSRNVSCAWRRDTLGSATTTSHAGWRPTSSGPLSAWSSTSNSGNVEDPLSPAMARTLAARAPQACRATAAGRELPRRSVRSPTSRCGSTRRGPNSKPSRYECVCSLSRPSAKAEFKTPASRWRERPSADTMRVSRAQAHVSIPPIDATALLVAGSADERASGQGPRSRSRRTSRERLVPRPADASFALEEQACCVEPLLVPLRPSVLGAGSSQSERSAAPRPVALAAIGRSGLIWSVLKFVTNRVHETSSSGAWRTVLTRCRRCPPSGRSRPPLAALAACDGRAPSTCLPCSRDRRLRALPAARRFRRGPAAARRG